jgi:hypothetical protein
MTEGVWLRKPNNDLTVVFIHGFNSSEECWKSSNGTYWPSLLKDENDFPSIGIYVFSYRTSFFRGNYNLGDVVDALKTYLHLDEVLKHSQVIFVCHSMGGIVARRFIVSQQLGLLENGLKKVGLFLVASPSLGSEYANMLGTLVNFIGVSRFIGNTQTDALRFSQDNTWLNDLDKDFINLKDAGRLSIKGQELIEELPILIIKSIFFFFKKQKQIVEPFSGARYFGDSFKVPKSDHFTIARPESNLSIQHRLLCDFIKNMKGGKKEPKNVDEISSQFITNPLKSIETGEISENIKIAPEVEFMSTNEQFYIDLIGRSGEEKDILDYLADPKAYPAIGIWGMGGIGKTRIAREVYLECKKQNLFRVGWLDPSKIFIKNTGSEYYPAFETALDHIAQILDRSDLKRLEGEKKKNEIASLLRSNPVLLIFDNMETLYDEQDKTAKDLISLFSESKSKLIFTSRTKFKEQDYSIWLKKLEGLDKDNGITLIREISKVKKFEQITNASDEILAKITHKLGGLPLALNLAVSQLVSTDLDSALEGFQDVSFLSGADDNYSEFYKFIFLNSWKLIDSNCKKILYVLAERPEGANEKAKYIRFQADLSEQDLRKAIQENWKYAFIEIQQPLEVLGSKLYSLHPLTRSFVRTDIKYY